MKYQSIAIAALSTIVGIAVVQASSAMSALRALHPSTARASVPPNSLEATVDRVVPTEGGPVVLLKPAGIDQHLPIWIGYAEARAIERARAGVDMSRPMTHDLFADTLAELEANVAHVRVDRLRDDGVYVGTVTVVRGSDVLAIDARPSDAMALALRTNSPIYIDGALKGQLMTIDADRAGASTAPAAD